jgi:hypothetical protein
MKAAFKEEGIPFPEFKGNQMASPIAYEPGDEKPGGGQMGEGQMGGE